MEIDRQKKAEMLERAIKHIDITAHDPRALIDAYKQMSFSARELGTRLRPLRAHAAGRALHHHPDDRRQQQRRRLHAGLRRPAAPQHGRHRRGDRGDRGRHGLLRGARLLALSRHPVRRRRAAARPLHRPDLRHLHRRGGAAELRRRDQGDRRRAGAAAVLVAPVHRRDGPLAVGRIRRAPSSRARSSRRRYELGVPVFCPAFSDSSAGFGLVAHQAERPERASQHRFGARLPRADAAQDRRRRYRPPDDRRRLAQELRPGYGGLRRDPGPRRADAQIQHPGHGRRRARRRLLELEPQGGDVLGQGRRGGRADGVRRGDAGPAAARRPTAITAAAGRSGKRRELARLLDAA